MSQRAGSQLGSHAGSRPASQAASASGSFARLPPAGGSTHGGSQAAGGSVRNPSAAGSHVGSAYAPRSAAASAHAPSAAGGSYHPSPAASAAHAPSLRSVGGGPSPAASHASLTASRAGADAPRDVISVQSDPQPQASPFFAGYQEPDPAAFQQMLLLNVGGVNYDTTLGTVLKYPQGRLGMMFQEPHALPRDDSGRWFIDRNGALFQHVLDFLREGTIQGVAPDDAVKVTQLSNEFQHYGLPHVLPFEELFQREDMTAYAAGAGGGGRRGGVRGASYTHLRVVHDAHGRVVNIYMPEVQGLPQVPKPDSAALDAVLEHYGAQGYTAVGCSPCAPDGHTQVLLRRDTSRDRDGAFRPVTNARAGAHPSSDRPATSEYELPKEVMEILGRVKAINGQVKAPPPTPNVAPGGYMGYGQ